MKILNSIKIKNVDFKNRIVMSPMVPFGLSPCIDGIMGDELLHSDKKTCTRSCDRCKLHRDIEQGKCIT